MPKDPTNTSKTFGARFAESWDLLQSFLGDIDARELEQISQMEMEETLQMLRRQPAVGFSEPVHSSKEFAPEELAIAIVQSRLNALVQAVDPKATEAWGARFLQSWKEMKLPLSAFNYALIQALKAADEQRAKQILQRNLKLAVPGKSKWPGASDPAQVAMELGHSWQLRQLTVALIFSG